MILFLIGPDQFRLTDQDALDAKEGEWLDKPVDINELLSCLKENGTNSAAIIFSLTGKDMNDEVMQKVHLAEFVFNKAFHNTLEEAPAVVWQGAFNVAGGNAGNYTFGVVEFEAGIGCQVFSDYWQLWKAEMDAMS